MGTGAPPAPVAGAARRAGLVRATAVLALGLPTVLLIARTHVFAPEAKAPPSTAREVPRPAATQPSAKDTTVRQWQGSAWLRQGGLAHGQAINRSVADLNTEIMLTARQERDEAGRVTLDPKDFRRVCGTLNQRVDAAQKYFPAPGKKAREAWTDALGLLERGARGCLETAGARDDTEHVTNNEKARLFFRSVEDIRQGVRALSGVFADINRVAAERSG